MKILYCGPIRSGYTGGAGSAERVHLRLLDELGVPYDFIRDEAKSDGAWSRAPKLRLNKSVHYRDETLKLLQDNYYKFIMHNSLESFNGIKYGADISSNHVIFNHFDHLTTLKTYNATYSFHHDDIANAYVAMLKGVDYLGVFSEVSQTQLQDKHVLMPYRLPKLELYGNVVANTMRQPKALYFGRIDVRKDLEFFIQSCHTAGIPGIILSNNSLNTSHIKLISKLNADVKHVKYESDAQLIKLANECSIAFSSSQHETYGFANVELSMLLPTIVRKDKLYYEHYMQFDYGNIIPVEDDLIPDALKAISFDYQSVIEGREKYFEWEKSVPDTWYKFLTENGSHKKKLYDTLVQRFNELKVIPVTDYYTKVLGRKKACNFDLDSLHFNNAAFKVAQINGQCCIVGLDIENPNASMIAKSETTAFDELFAI